MSTLLAAAAIAAATVAGSVGVNTHLDFNNFGYQNLAKTADDINYLGLKHLRDCPNHPGTLWATVANATGARFLAFIGETSLNGAGSQLNNMDALAAAGLLDGIDGPNEWDVAFSLSQGVNIQMGAIFQQQVFAKGRLLNLPVVNMSFGAGWVAPLFEGDYVKVGDLSPWADYGNAHTYPVSTSQSAEFSINRINGLAQRAAVGRPVITTEIGFKTDVFPDRDQARYTLFTVFDGIRFGNPRTYFYALYDDGSGPFGFVRKDGTRKPSADALHNLMGMLRDIGTASGATLGGSIDGTTANDNTLLMQKSDGSFLLAVWNEKDLTHAVTLNLPSTAQINVRDPLTGSGIIATANSNTLVLTIPDHPILVEIVPAAPAPPPPPPPPPPVLQTPTGVTLSVGAVSLDDQTPVGTVVAMSTVQTSDGLPFTGTEVADVPFGVLADGSLAVSAALPTGPTTLTPLVTATGNGVSDSTPLSVTVTHIVPPPPPPPQTPTGVTLSVSAVSLPDTTPIGTVVAAVTVPTSDGLPFLGSLAVTAPFAMSSDAHVVVASALPTGPVTFTPVVSASENNVTATAPLVVTDTHLLTWNPGWIAPAALTDKVNTVLGPSLGISVTDPFADGHAGTMALNLGTVGRGTISARNASGALVAGSGTAKINFSGSFAQVNALLGTLTYTSSTTGAATLSLDIWDQGGKEAKKSVPITVTP